jgi:hypothetical protein
MTNDERELVEMMARAGQSVDLPCDKTIVLEGKSVCLLSSWVLSMIAPVMLSVVKANIGKIAKSCPECHGEGKIGVTRLVDHRPVFGHEECVCHGSGVVKKGE